uniref:Neurobeachin (inferred by orthology to a D. melanogaster protein) n=1 Tax=Strongyloides venezuelensis TaxID=75913 RepID=A0A0K0F9C5_STRVS
MSDEHIHQKSDKVSPNLDDMSDDDKFISTQTLIVSSAVEEKNIPLTLENSIKPLVSEEHKNGSKNSMENYNVEEFQNIELCKEPVSEEIVHQNENLLAHRNLETDESSSIDLLKTINDIEIAGEEIDLNTNSNESDKKDESETLDETPPLPPPVLGHVIHNSDESPNESLERLEMAFERGNTDPKIIIEEILNVLVGGAFDLDSKFRIEYPKAIDTMLKVLDKSSVVDQVETWTMFSHSVKKSFINLEACSEIGLISKLLDRLPNYESIVADLIIQLLSVLSSYSITVKETKRFLRALHATNGVWPRYSVKLLSVMKEMPKKDTADVFFSFPGKELSGLALPPLVKWPYQNGWTFSTWLRMDPSNGSQFERETPYLFYFCTEKGLGYSGYFMGSCLVIRCIKSNNNVGGQKECIKCIKQPLIPRKWHHIALSFNYSRWGKNDISVYIDGALIETLEANWLVSTTDHFNRCFIGCGPNENNPNESFCGQICAIYVFSQSISPQQASCLFCLGPGYQSYFKHDAESNLPDGYKKHLFDGSLNNSMVLAYCPKNCHEQLCLMPSNKITTSKASSGSQAMNSFFVQVPHAILKNVKVVTTHSIHSSLHSVGGIQMLLPLFTQVDMLHTDHSTMIDYDICANLLSVISLLLKTSVSAQQQLFHSKGFLIVAHTLSNVSPNHLTLDVLKTLIEMTRFLMKYHTTGLPLLKHLVDHILFNPQLWYRAQYHVQKELYKYLIEEGLGKNGLGTVIRRTPAVLELVHALKINYWIARPTDYTEDNTNVKICETKRVIEEIKTIRKLILDLIDKLMFNKEQLLNKDSKRDEEFQIIFNFLATESRDENLFDILNQIMRQLAIHAAIMVPAFDNNKGICVIFDLMSSPNENIRIPVLKILGNFLCRSTIKRKNDSIHNQNLLALISDKLLQNCTYLSKACYNVLYEILVEEISSEINGQNDSTKSNTNSINFENPHMLKVIANLITQSELCNESMEVRKSFLEDLLKLCSSNKDNRRTILQLSVWQEWLISLAFIYPKTDVEASISEIVYKIFKVLLEHAIKIEFGGWRVWVDTLAISHAKVSWENHQREIRQGNSNGNVACYRTPDFVWSHVQLRLLSDLLDSIETTISKYNTSGPVFTDFITGIDNQTFISNTIHIISQLSDSLVISCGGLLPLLAAATSPNSELDIVDTSKQGLAIYDATRLLHRFALLADSFIFMSAAQLTELEQEKNMPNGGILRQMLRLSATIAVRNILACRVSKNERPSLILPGDNATHKQLQRADAIIQFIDECFPNYKNILDIINGLPSPNYIPDVESLLQNSDLSRLRGIVYRDMDEPRQAQFLALAIIYFLSVLMVSRYRDILEPPTTPSPFFDTNNSGQTLKSSPLNGMGSNCTSKNSLVHEDEIPDTFETVQQNCEEEKDRENVEENIENEKSFKEIASIKITDNTTIVNKPTVEETNQLNHFNNSDAIKFLSMTKSEKQAYLTERLQKALESTAPVLREIMMDFKNYLQKSLLGTHGQEIMNDDKVMQTLKNLQGSVIELVMLLCSQEWQTSLQKHAGLAFIELVNEGRLMAHATREHILRVANEADFILNRLRAEDVSKHTAFQNDSNDRLRERKEQERLCEHLIESARRRDLMIAEKMLENMKTMIMSPNGAWSDNEQEPMIFWKLDTWEDDSRRRKRFIPNPHGGRLSMVRLHQTTDIISEEAISESRQKLLKELKKRNAIVSSFGNNSNTQEHQVEDGDICKWLEESMDIETTKKDSNSIYSTPCKLIAPGLVVPGTISITMSDLYFDADEGDDLYGKQNPKVSLLNNN